MKSNPLFELVYTHNELELLTAFRPVGNCGLASIVFLYSGSLPHDHLAKYKKQQSFVDIVGCEHFGVLL